MAAPSMTRSVRGRHRSSTLNNWLNVSGCAPRFSKSLNCWMIPCLASGFKASIIAGALPWTKSSANCFRISEIFCGISREAALGALASAASSHDLKAAQCLRRSSCNADANLRSASIIETASIANNNQEILSTQQRNGSDDVYGKQEQCRDALTDGNLRRASWSPRPGSGRRGNRRGNRSRCPHWTPNTPLLRRSDRPSRSIRLETSPAVPRPA